VKLRRYIPPISILLFLALTAVGGYYVRKVILERHMREAIALDDGATIRSLLKSWPAPVNARGPDSVDRYHYPDSGDTPLLWAARNKDAESVRLCIAHRADLNALGRLGETALYLAAEDNQTEIVRLLAGAGADATLGHSGFTPLHSAVMQNNKEMAELLISAGADVNAANDDGDYFTPLHLASGGEVPKEIVELLIRKGARVDARDVLKATPLHYAASSSSVAVAVLLAHGADRNARDRDGRTPLHHAARRDNVESVKLLIAAGANVNAQDDSGYTPLDVEGSSFLGEHRQDRADEVTAVLRKAGGREGPGPVPVPDSIFH
jgi:hypothetical protein